MTINAWFVILRDFEFFEKRTYVEKGFYFRKIRAIVLKLRTNILNPSRNIWPKSIEAFKFFQILNFLIIFFKIF